MRKNEIISRTIENKLKITASAIAITALMSCGVEGNAEDTLPATEFTESGINQAATATRQAERLNLGASSSSSNGLEMIRSFNNNFITDQQVETVCVSRQLDPGAFFSQLFHYIDGLNSNPSITSGGFVNYDYISSDRSVGFGGPYYPNPIDNRVVIEFGTTHGSAAEASKWTGTTTFSVYNQSNIGEPISSVPTSIFSTDIDCPLQP